MPYKEKLRSPAKKPRPKATYKVSNWSDYNKNLKNRGNLSIYLPEGCLDSLLVNKEPYIQGVAGQQVTYNPAYIELLFIYYKLLGFGIRQLTGYMEDVWRTKGIDLKVPSFGHLSDLFAKTPVKVKHFCKDVVKRLEAGEDVELICDSTGMRFGKASYWYAQKYGKAPKNRPWSMFHIGMDGAFEIYDVQVTENTGSDIGELDRLIAACPNVSKVTGDGAYYSAEVIQKLHEKGIDTAIPPPRNAVIHGQPETSVHDAIVEYIKEKGTIYAWYKKSGYGLRALVEAQISRIKRCLGSSLLTQRLSSRKAEGVITATIINKWNSLGRCVSVKTA